MRSFPSGREERDDRPHSIHMLCLTLYAIQIAHHMDLEQRARHCAERRRTSFLFMFSALNIPGATVCPGTPAAIL